MSPPVLQMRTLRRRELGELPKVPEGAKLGSAESANCTVVLPPTLLPCLPYKSYLSHVGKGPLGTLLLSWSQHGGGSRCAHGVFCSTPAPGGSGLRHCHQNACWASLCLIYCSVSPTWPTAAESLPAPLVSVVCKPLWCFARFCSVCVSLLLFLFFSFNPIKRTLS